MNYNLCTISFRHELVSFKELINFAYEVGFGGIELWSVHAKALLKANSIDQITDEMRRFDLNIPMISDYLDIMTSEENFELQIIKFENLLHTASLFGSKRIRIFAGNKGSFQLHLNEWKLCVRRLRDLANRASEKNIYLVIETHPNTLADTLDSTIRLINEIDHKQLRINLDFFHLWESGTSPNEAFNALSQWVDIIHLKNVNSRDQMTVFHPLNIYSPNGSREGIASLAEGIVEYEEVIRYLIKYDQTLSASLEWFGEFPFRALRRDIQWLNTLNSPSKNNHILSK